MTRGLATLIISLAAWGAPLANAQTATGAVTYRAGWNMVAAVQVESSPGILLSGPLLFYVDGRYQPMAVPALLSGTAGAWAYLPASETIVIRAPTRAVTAPVVPGWNLVGDPYAVPATLPPSTTAYWWDGRAGSYRQVTAIPIGGAVWVYAESAGELALQAGIPGA